MGDRSHPKFTQRHLSRALKAAAKAGLHVVRYRINPQGQIEVETGQPAARDSVGASNPWDRAIEELKR